MTALPGPTRFTSDSCTAAAYDHGAHVVEWTPAGHDPVLWMSASSRFDETSPIRGGVPICLPWFGAGRAQNLAPAHGVARILRWSTSDPVRATTGMRATFTLDIPASDAVPSSLHAEYVATFGSELDLQLTVTNTGDVPCTIEEALHTYLAIGDIHSVTVSGLDGCEYLDKTPGASTEPLVQQGEVTFAGETDRVYRGLGSVVVTDPLLARRIIVTKSNAANTVVWNPWVAKAAAMPDFGDAEWPEMLCIEEANVLQDAITLAAGTSHTMGYHLRVERLD